MGSAFRAWLAWLLVSSFVASANGQPAQTKPVSPSTPASVEAALDQKADFAFSKRPLEEVLVELGKRTKIPLRVEWRRLEADLKKLPITFAAKQMSYRSALRRILREVEAAFYADDGLLVITAPEAVASRIPTRVYDIRDLIDSHDADSRRGRREVINLIGLVEQAVAPQSWDAVGGPGTIGPGIGKTLVVATTLDVHEQLAGLLAEIRKARTEFAKNPWKPRPQMAFPAFPDEPVRQALDKRISHDFEKSTLKDFAAALAAEAGVNIFLNHRRLDEVGYSGDTPVTANVSGMTLRQALETALKELELTFEIRDEALEIRPDYESCHSYWLRIYAIDDLTGPFSLEEQWLDPAGRSQRWRKLISESIMPQSWDIVGGPNLVRFVFNPPSLWIVANCAREHEQIAKFMSDLRKAQPPAPAKFPTAAELDAAYAQRLIERRWQLATQTPATPSPSGKAPEKPLTELPDAEAVLRVIRKQVGPEATWGDPQAYLDHVGSAILMRGRPGIVEQVEGFLEQHRWLQPK